MTTTSTESAYTPLWPQTAVGSRTAPRVARSHGSEWRCATLIVKGKFFYAERNVVNRRQFLHTIRNAIPLLAIGSPAVASPVAPLPGGAPGRRWTGATTGASMAVVALGVSVADYGAVGDGTTDDTAAVQAALTQAARTGVPLVFEKGVYRVEGLTVSSFPRVTLLGRGEKSSIIKLRDNNGGGGIGQILRVSDVIEFAMYDIGIHGNFAKAKPSQQVEPL